MASDTNWAQAAKFFDDAAPNQDRTACLMGETLYMLPRFSAGDAVDMRVIGSSVVVRHKPAAGVWKEFAPVAGGLK